MCARLDDVRTPRPRKRKAARRENAKNPRGRLLLRQLQELWEARDPRYLMLVDCFRDLLAREMEQRSAA